MVAIYTINNWYPFETIVDWYNRGWRSGNKVVLCHRSIGKVLDSKRSGSQAKVLDHVATCSFCDRLCLKQSEIHSTECHIYIDKDPSVL